MRRSALDPRLREGPARRTVEAAIARGGMSRAARRAAKKSARKRGRGWTK